jgi:hypothetical protein
MSVLVPTYYDVLQVERDATPDRIRHAWRRLAQKYHPDKHSGSANAARAMAAINAAYEILSDPHQRAIHDQWIEHAESQPMPLQPAAAPVRRERQTFWEFASPENGWPWYLLFATTAFALGTIGTAIYLTAMPAKASPPAVQQQQPAVVTTASAPA